MTLGANHVSRAQKGGDPAAAGDLRLGHRAPGRGGRQASIPLPALTTLRSALGAFGLCEFRVSQQISTFYGPSVQAMETRLGAGSDGGPRRFTVCANSAFLNKSQHFTVHLFRPWRPGSAPAATAVPDGSPSVRIPRFSTNLNILRSICSDHGDPARARQRRRSPTVHRLWEFRVSQQISTFYGPSVHAMETRLARGSHGGPRRFTVCGNSAFLNKSQHFTVHLFSHGDPARRGSHGGPRRFTDVVPTPHACSGQWPVKTKRAHARSCASVVTRKRRH